ncbi:hypothetical protein SAMN04487997_0385 [Frateuria terrea]|uniref:Lipoprotein n=1 Tax=Frateuria terrea TaxID=529704 RepID=A0A1H6QIA9_9GAMM|nr:hypothetical protein SAMN04487997_0385 [Frateuria terrea]SFP04461.1 hypothetical protein SAMN02927913_0300 [Frateuria terrea]
MHRHTSLLLLSLVLVTSCTGRGGASDVAQAVSTAPLVDAAHGFTITVPHDMHVRHDFQRSYLANAAWKSFAGDDNHGTPVLALVLDGSNRITAAELRIGVGDDAAARAHCLDEPSSGVPALPSQVTLAGVPFTRFHAADAAMSHYLDVEAYRAVHAGRCYAIDLLLTGTRPEVYDPPATPPFGHDTALARLHEALGGLRFTD